MKGKRYTEEQIIGVLKEHDAGAPTKELGDSDIPHTLEPSKPGR